MPIEEHHSSVAPAAWPQGVSPESGTLAIERMPGLGYALEQFSLGVPDALALFCQANASGLVDELRPTQVFEFLRESQGLVAAVLNCAAYEARMLMVFDERIADTIVGAVFGGDGQGAAGPRARRSMTNVETALIGEFTRHLTKALTKGFAQNRGLAFAYQRLEVLGDIYTLGRRDMPAIAARMTIEIEGGPTQITLLFPQSLLLPVRKDLTIDPGSEAPTSDPRWIRELKAGVTKAPLKVTAVLEEVEMTLGDVAEFEVGKVLPLQGVGMGRVRLECVGHKIFWCKLGEADGRYSLKVEEAIVQEDDAELSPVN